MKRTVVLLALFFGGIFMQGAVAADLAPLHYSRPAPGLPFPRSEQAQSVWAGGACWDGCGSYCAWGMAGCLQQDSQGRCLKLTDKCDRYCQRECRTEGGPLVAPLLGLLD